MSVAQYGRYGDDHVAHVAKGELVVPKQVLRKRPDLRQEIYKEIEKYGVKGKRYVVGNKSNSINPHTGHPEFFLKKILPAVTGTIGFVLGGPAGAAIGAGIGSAARGDNPSNIATNALMGYGLGAFGGAAGLKSGAGFSEFGRSVQSTFFPSAAQKAATAQTAGMSVQPGNIAALKAKQAASKTATQKALEFAGKNKLLTGALGIGALGGLGAFKEEEGSLNIPPPPEPGSEGQLDVSPGQVRYYDPQTRGYSAITPQIPQIYQAKDGGDIKNFPRKTGQIDGPGTEKSDDIPAMLSDGEFVMTAAAVRGLGALNGADKDDKLEQRRKGAKMMYEMMDKFESKVA